jgi:hypothetical protein
MNSFKKVIGSTVLFAMSFVVGMPLVNASPVPQVGIQFRVFDRNHKDYHDWDDREDRDYRGYLESRHRPYIEYRKQNNKEQKNYWNYRHSHPDKD